MKSFYNLAPPAAGEGEESCTQLVVVDFVNSLQILTDNNKCVTNKTKLHHLFPFADNNISQCQEATESSSSMSNVLNSSSEEVRRAVQQASQREITPPRRRHDGSLSNHGLPTRFHHVASPKNCSENKHHRSSSKSSGTCTMNDSNEFSRTNLDLGITLDFSKIDVSRETESNSRIPSRQRRGDEASANRQLLLIGKRNLPNKKSYSSDLWHADLEDKPSCSSNSGKPADILKDVPPRQVKRAPSSRYVHHRQQNSFATLCNEALQELYGKSLHSVATEASMTDRQNRTSTTTMPMSSHHSSAARRNMPHHQHQKRMQRTLSAASSGGRSGSSCSSEISSLGMADADADLSEYEYDDDNDQVDYKDNNGIIAVEKACLNLLVPLARKEKAYPRPCRMDDFVPKRPVRHVSPTPPSMNRSR